MTMNENIKSQINGLLEAIKKECGYNCTDLGYIESKEREINNLVNTYIKYCIEEEGKQCK